MPTPQQSQDPLDNLPTPVRTEDPLDSIGPTTSMDPLDQAFPGAPRTIDEARAREVSRIFSPDKTYFGNAVSLFGNVTGNALQTAGRVAHGDYMDRVERFAKDDPGTWAPGITWHVGSHLMHGVMRGWHGLVATENLLVRKYKGGPTEDLPSPFQILFAFDRARAEKDMGRFWGVAQHFLRNSRFWYDTSGLPGAREMLEETMDAADSGQGSAQGEYMSFGEALWKKGIPVWNPRVGGVSWVGADTILKGMGFEEAAARGEEVFENWFSDKRLKRWQREPFNLFGLDMQFDAIQDWWNGLIYREGRTPEGDEGIMLTKEQFARAMINIFNDPSWGLSFIRGAKPVRGAVQHMFGREALDDLIARLSSGPTDDMLRMFIEDTFDSRPLRSLNQLNPANTHVEDLPTYYSAVRASSTADLPATWNSLAEGIGRLDPHNPDHVQIFEDIIAPLTKTDPQDLKMKDVGVPKRIRDINDEVIPDEAADWSEYFAARYADSRNPNAPSSGQIPPGRKVLENLDDIEGLYNPLRQGPSFRQGLARVQTSDGLEDLLDLISDFARRAEFAEGPMGKPAGRLNALQNLNQFRLAQDPWQGVTATQRPVAIFPDGRVLYYNIPSGGDVDPFNNMNVQLFHRLVTGAPLDAKMNHGNAVWIRSRIIRDPEARRPTLQLHFKFPERGLQHGEYRGYVDGSAGTVRQGFWHEEPPDGMYELLADEIEQYVLAYPLQEQGYKNARRVRIKTEGVRAAQKAEVDFYRSNYGWTPSDKLVEEMKDYNQAAIKAGRDRLRAMPESQRASVEAARDAEVTKAKTKAEEFVANEMADEWYDLDMRIEVTYREPAKGGFPRRTVVKFDQSDISQMINRGDDFRDRINLRATAENLESVEDPITGEIKWKRGKKGTYVEQRAQIDRAFVEPDLTYPTAEEAAWAIQAENTSRWDDMVDAVLAQKGDTIDYEDIHPIEHIFLRDDTIIPQMRKQRLNAPTAAETWATQNADLPEFHGDPSEVLYKVIKKDIDDASAKQAEFKQRVDKLVAEAKRKNEYESAKKYAELHEMSVENVLIDRANLKKAKQREAVRREQMELQKQAKRRQLTAGQDQEVVKANQAERARRQAAAQAARDEVIVRGTRQPEIINADDIFEAHENDMVVRNRASAGRPASPKVAAEEMIDVPSRPKFRLQELIPGVPDPQVTLAPEVWNPLAAAEFDRYRVGEAIAQSLNSRFPWLNPKSDSSRRIGRVWLGRLTDVDGTAINLLPDEAEALAYLKWLTHTMADQAGIPRSDNILDYFTAVLRKDKSKHPRIDLSLQETPDSGNQFFSHMLPDAMHKGEASWDVAEAMRVLLRGMMEETYIRPAIKESREAAKQYKMLPWTRAYHNSLLDKLQGKPSRIDVAFNSAANWVLDHTGFTWDNPLRPYLNNPATKWSYFVTRQWHKGLLGFSLPFMIKNSAQVINIAADVGSYSTLHGVQQMLRPSGRHIAKQQNLIREWHGFFDDIGETSVSGLRRTADSIIFKPVTASEFAVRGVAYHAGMHAEARAMGIPMAEALADPATALRLMVAGHTVAQRTQFIYGVLGRSPFFQNFIMRQVGQFVTFPIKQATFIADMMKNDPTGFGRYIMLSGYYSRLFQEAGIDPTGFIGFGFIPEHPSGLPIHVSPAMAASFNLARLGMTFLPDGDLDERQYYLKQTAEDAFQFAIPGGLQLQKLAKFTDRYATGEVHTDAGNLVRRLNEGERFTQFFGLPSLEGRMTREMVNTLLAQIQHTNFQRRLIATEITALINKQLELVEQGKSKESYDWVYYNQQLQGMLKTLGDYQIYISDQTVENAVVRREHDTLFRTIMNNKYTADAALVNRIRNMFPDLGEAIPEFQEQETP